MSDLASFQAGFAAALMEDGQPLPQFRAHAFAVYRNTTARGAVEALRAAYPTVDMLVGDEMFTQVALDYRSERPPSSPVLSDYGADFASFLSRQSWTSELPYIADVARLDWLWLECFLAGDADQGLPLAGEQSKVMLHPAARFGWFETPAMTIWQAHRANGGIFKLEPEWRDEGALFTRIGWEVHAQRIDAACYHILAECAGPIDVSQCVAIVAKTWPAADVSKLLQSCVASHALMIF